MVTLKELWVVQITWSKLFLEAYFGYHRKGIVENKKKEKEKVPINDIKIEKLVNEISSGFLDIKLEVLWFYFLKKDKNPSKLY